MLTVCFQGTGTAITAKNISGNDNPKSSNTESIWVEGLVPGIDFCNHSKSSNKSL